MSRQGAVGLVAIGRNEGERLRLCLRSVPDAMPVAYVDSGSTDGSADFARSVGAVVVELDLGLPFTAARARNAGFEAILHAWPDLAFVQFVDGDCELESGWLAAAETFLRAEPSVAAVCGRRRERYPERSFYNGLCDAEWNTPIGEAEACGGDAMFRVAAFVQAKGYDPAVIAGEEPELCHRLRGLGWRIWRIDSPMTIHDADMHHARQWWTRAVRSGFGYAQVWRKTSKGTGGGLYLRPLASALFWTFGVALAGLLAAFAFGPVGLLAAPALWFAQLARLARRGGLVWGWHMLAGKLAETSGILRYLRTRVRGGKQGAIFYK
ncbi:MAG: glycosyl transferase [Alphaproteobacteria bacterium HGW-Alphaproteobacteria-5]|jgi:glycosyltransferase involved in cell wall biosynthesis|nr:MAG: glycosyl transferase [Alphaproteobacteria bacterium HGW-Alphaproteobacteria-5]